MTCPLCRQPIPDEIREDWIRLYLSELSLTSKMTKQQEMIFEAILNAKGATVSYETLAEHIWPIDADMPDLWIDTIQVQAKGIRGILDGTPFTIENVRGRGYRLAQQEKTDETRNQDQ